MLDIRKRTGWLFLSVMLAQVILVSAQVQTKTGVRVLSAFSTPDCDRTHCNKRKAW